MYIYILYYYVEIKESVLVVKKTSPEAVLKETRQKCCNYDCLSNLSMEGIVEQRGRYWSKSFRERRNDLEAMIEQSKQGRNLRSGGKGPTEKRMLFNGMRICANTWCVTHRISRSV